MSKQPHIENGFLVYKRLLNSTRQYFGIFILGILGMLVMSLSDASFTYLIKPIVDKGFVAKDVHFIHWLPLIILLVFLVRGIGGFFSTYFISRVSRNVVMDFRQAIFKHLLQLPVRYYDKHSSGQMLSTIVYNVDQIANASSEALLTILREGTLLIGLVIVMFTVSWKLSLLFLTITPVSFWMVKQAGKRMRRISAEVQKSVGDVTHAASEAIDGFKLVRLFNGEEFEINKFDQLTRQTRQRELKLVVANSTMSSSVQLVTAVAIGLVIFCSISLQWGVSAGGFASIVAAMFGLLRPLRRMTSVNNMIQQGIAGAASVYDLLDEPIELQTGTLPLRESKGEIEFRNVSFRYDHSSDYVLHDISFTIKPGETVALVGKSGAGKSTLINLLPRFYEIEEGDILLDGVDIRQYVLPDLRKQYAVVAQNPVLFNDTVKNNIAYAAGVINEAKLYDSAISSHSLEFIQDLPKKFDTIVGEDGVLLSGGQRQRIAIARALFKDAPILILDEATSALDTRAERFIQDALNELMKHRTTFVIAHRLSTIENADRILVLDKGRIVESGTHQELLAKNGAYTELHQMQFAEA